jgi:hypothetical protein
MQRSIRVRSFGVLRRTLAVALEWGRIEHLP